MEPKDLLWLVAIASLVGTVANAHGRRWCFFIWLGTNLIWCVRNFYIGEIHQASLRVVYAMLAVYGLFKWRNGRENQEKEDL